MAFRTKLDYSSGRQIRQTEQTVTPLVGATVFGLPFADLSSGPNLNTSAATQVYSNVVTTFSGTPSGTTFNFGHSAMTGTQIYLNTITPVNSNDIQVVEPHFIGISGQTNPNFGNTYYNRYEGVGYDLTVTNFVEYAPNQYSGTAISETVTKYRADGWDYKGDGVWVNVRGKLKTEKLIITNGAANGLVLGCVDSSGTTGWVTVSGGTGGFNYFTSGTSGTHSIRINGVATTDATGDYAFALGQLNTASGLYSLVQGFSNTASGNHSHVRGISNTASGTYSSILGNGNSVTGDQSHILGYNNVTNATFNFIVGEGNKADSDFNFIFGKNHILSASTNSVILGGVGITGDTSDTVYVPYLNIRNLKGGASVTDIGLDSRGFVVDVLSDSRLKENVNTINGALDKVLNLRGVTYNWIDRESGGNDLRVGFIAQEVNEVMEELVFQSRDGRYLGVRYDNVTPLLVEAIKELVQNGEDNLITSKYIPTSTDDKEGEIGDVVCDDNYMYVKTKTGWGRTTLEKF